MRYPYFISDAFMIGLAIALLAIAALTPSVLNLALAALAVCVLASIYVFNSRKINDFAKGMESIEGLKSWEPEFFSLGTVVLDYLGSKVHYSSDLGMSTGESIPVTYRISMRNDNQGEFDYSAGSIPKGAIEDKVLKEIERFNRSYPLVRLRNQSGILELTVKLEFIKARPSSKSEKIKTMAEFLSDFLTFGLMLNEYLERSGNSKGKS